ncbi:MAG: tRNA preQ1(34) S-adenosylmethionine ribosyltransferase-isomerase QueA [Anaerolineales bacterium]
MKTSDFDYDLPQRFIAQTPVEPRDSARMLVLYRSSGVLEHSHFRDLPKYLKKGDLLVLNETRVIPARLFAKKIPTGGKVEILLLRREDNRLWEVLVGGKGLTVGRELQVENGPKAVIVADLDGPKRLIQFDELLSPNLNRFGNVPLPPYIHEKLDDPNRYQTIYAQDPGSAAAPTAGMHFTDDLMQHLDSAGIQFAKIVLHIGLDTFLPVTEDDPTEHKIHTEWCRISSSVAEKINTTKREGHRVIAVGTTSVRVVESAARFVSDGGIVSTFEGLTDLFILPGYNFRVVDAMITNFHLPRSTLIMLVSAFVGRKRILSAYEIAKEEGYRFYSFGDAMLIL